MATKAGDLQQNLVNGGLPATAASIIANAIANAATPQYSQTRDLADATPIDQLRLITANTRKYQLTNLDYSSEQPFQDRLSRNPGQFSDTKLDHPYKDAQPASSTPPLSRPSIRGGDYITVTNDIQDGAVQSTITLNLVQPRGTHLRLNPASKTVESVEYSTDIPQEQFLSAAFVEKQNGTQLQIVLKNLQTLSVRMADGTTKNILAWVP